MRVNCKYRLSASGFHLSYGKPDFNTRYLKSGVKERKKSHQGRGGEEVREHSRIRL